MMRLTSAAALAACTVLGACESAPPPADAVTPADTSVAAAAAVAPLPAAAIETEPAPHGPAVQPVTTTAAASDGTVRDRAPATIRGIYLNAYAAGSSNRLRQLLALAERTEINTFVVDVKDEKGIHYRTQVPLAGQLAQPGEITIRDIRAFTDTLHARGIYAIARIVVFKDPILSKAKPEWSVQTPGGDLWIDKAGNSWVSTWEPAVWQYNIDIAAEVIEAGFDEVQFDYIRFPEAYASLPDQVHPKEAGSRTDAIVAFLRQANARIHPLGGVVAADVFGLSPNDAGDVRIGQQWEPILATADHVLPMVYPSHYFPTHLKNVPRPNRMPYETVFTSLGIGRLRIQRLEAAGVKTARVIPWLQAFSAPWVERDYDYGPQQAADQIRAVYDVGLDDWIFWHPGSRYEQVAEAFEPDPASRAKDFQPEQWLVDYADLVDRSGAAAARERVVEAARAGTTSAAGGR